MNLDNFEITSGILTNPVCLNKARALLYESYIQHLAWEITHDNPSNIKICHEDGHTTLQDDYDDLSVWFSISHGEEVIACARLCYEDDNGLLEIERYENARQAIGSILAKKEDLNLIELNREAILPAYNETGVYYALLLLKTVFEYCLEHNHTILTTCNISAWLAIYDIISLEKEEKYSFKYFDSEPHPVWVYLITPDDIKQLLVNINSCLNETNRLKSLAVCATDSTRAC